MRINLRCIIIQDNKILLCKMIDKDFYFLPGGGLEEGETINNAILRELNEELGITPENILIDKNIEVIENFFEDDGIKYHEINLLKIVNIKHLKIQSQEDHISFEYIPINKLNEYKLLPEKIKNYILKNFI